MSQDDWDELRTPVACRDDLWELYHENSKIGRHDHFLPDEVIRARMLRLLESLRYDSYRSVPLPSVRTPLEMPLDAAISTRVSGRRMEPCDLGLADVATVLHMAYGITRLNSGTGFPRPFRTVPSGGALYPLEIYVHSRRIDSLADGLYHYSPTKNDLRHLQPGDMTEAISGAMVQDNIARDTTLLVFITALFERSAFKYGNRGYRFALLEAGHVAQNLNLAATGLGLGCLNVGGYYDREIDALLGIDGLTHSTIYMVGIGKGIEGGVADTTRNPDDRLSEGMV